MLIPSIIPIRREKGYHTEFIGKFGYGQQYMGFSFFLESRQKRPASVLHRFNSDGYHIGSAIYEKDRMQGAEKALEEVIAKLRNPQPGDIKVRPFNVELNGIQFGLIPRGDGMCIEYLPYGLAFFPPWDGTYDT